MKKIIAGGALLAGGILLLWVAVLYGESIGYLGAVVGFAGFGIVGYGLLTNK